MLKSTKRIAYGIALLLQSCTFNIGITYYFFQDSIEGGSTSIDAEINVEPDFIVTETIDEIIDVVMVKVLANESEKDSFQFVDSNSENNENPDKAGNDKSEPNKDEQIVDHSNNDICIVDETKKTDSSNCEDKIEKRPCRSERIKEKRREKALEKGFRYFFLNNIPMSFCRPPVQLSNFIRKENPYLDYKVEAENRQTTLVVYSGKYQRYKTNQKNNTFGFTLKTDDFMVKDILENKCIIKMGDKKIQVQGGGLGEAKRQFKLEKMMRKDQVRHSTQVYKDF